MVHAYMFNGVKDDTAPAIWFIVLMMNTVDVTIHPRDVEHTMVPVRAGITDDLSSS